ncbi:hypothetical protein OS242_02805 [Tumebacillus sp. DT12]|uniref:Zinc ribbon domain-containing protein n=1 Tax=Tumebacillus lacus TaxID=2995335 RepID=A0ABT3WW42_9BACL|nr:hypothetical protein [Tumebacillus lacus]MCX7568890.1 hypothetical protein [Tumebacillus lacus]
MKIVCKECYEENPTHAERCQRCGYLLENAKRDQAKSGHFEWQHHDAPNTIVRRTGKPEEERKKVW